MKPSYFSSCQSTEASVLVLGKDRTRIFGSNGLTRLSKMIRVGPPNPVNRRSSPREIERGSFGSNGFTRMSKMIRVDPLNPVNQRSSSGKIERGSFGSYGFTRISCCR